MKEFTDFKNNIILANQFTVPSTQYRVIRMYLSYFTYLHILQCKEPNSNNDEVFQFNF